MDSQNYYLQEYPNDFRVNILKKVKDYLTDTFDESTQRTVDDIAIRHRNLTQSPAGFRFKKQHFTHSQNQDEPEYKLQLLHPSLEDEFEIHLANWAAQRERQRKVDKTVGAALNIMGNTADLREMLPECIHCILPAADSVQLYLPVEKILKFKDQHADTLDLIKVQLVMKSLKG